MSPMSRDQRLNPGPAHYRSQKDFGIDGIKVRTEVFKLKHYVVHNGS